MTVNSDNGRTTIPILSIPELSLWETEPTVFHAKFRLYTVSSANKNI